MQEAEEESGVILDLQGEEQTEEKTITKAKVEVKEAAGKLFFLKWAIRSVKGDLLTWWDPGDHPRTRKQSLKRVLFLPAQMVSVLVLFACMFVAYLLFGDSEANTVEG